MTQIVDIHGLAEVLCCSVSTLNKTWREYPHFFIGSGETAKGARFDVEDVVNYLKGRDYAELGQEKQKLQRQGESCRVSTKNKDRVPHMGRCKRVGDPQEKGNKVNVPDTENTDPFNVLAGIQ